MPYPKKIFIDDCTVQGVVAVVTGGASGLGRATVERIVRQGGRVVLCDLPTSHGSQVAAGNSDNVLFAPTDVKIFCNKNRYLILP